MKANAEQSAGYGEDERCDAARALIRRKCGREDIGVHFVVGGTQANMTVIAAALRPFEGVLCADTGHINVHETGAVEATGHKVLALKGQNGKLNAQQVSDAMHAHCSDATHEHMVRPAMVYISQPTELGTLYTKAELEELSQVCRKAGLRLFVDGARLGYAMAAMPEVDYALLARLCDAFTIGGTKVGLLFGEAIVICDPALNDCFRYHIKQRGGMLAKGWLLGVQFGTLMEGDYYVDIARRANELAQELKACFVRHGCPLLCDTSANQIFPIVEDGVLARLSDRFVFSFWQRVDERHSAVRFCVSAVTSPKDVEALLQELDRVLG